MYTSLCCISSKPQQQQQQSAEYCVMQYFSGRVLHTTLCCNGLCVDSICPNRSLFLCLNSEIIERKLQKLQSYQTNVSNS